MATPTDIAKLPQHCATRRPVGSTRRTVDCDASSGDVPVEIPLRPTVGATGSG